MHTEECRILVHNLIFRAALHLKKMMKDVVIEHINMRTLQVLFLLDNQEPMSMTDFSKKLCLPKSNFTMIVNDLVKDAYVRRKPDDADRRLIYLELTEKGRLFIEENCSIIENQLANRLAATLSDEDIHNLSECIDKTVHILSKLE